jgi:recombination protein RecA
MPKKKDSQIAVTIDDLLEKHKGILDRGSSEVFEYARIPFDLPALDKLIGGGIPKKRITIFAGPSNSGKSYLASQVAASVQKSGGMVAWIDNEISWDAEWMTRCGVDVDNILLAQPTAGEAAFDLIRQLMNDGIDLIVLDSIAGLVPSAMADEDFGFNPMAWQARFVNQSLPRIMPALKHGTALIAINQMRQSIGNVTFIDSLPGGKAQTFFSHLVLEVRRSGWIGERDERVGFDIKITNRKSKSGGQQQHSCIIPFRFDGGIDLIETYVREAQNYNFVVKSGAWYRIMDETTNFQGMNGVKKFFLDNPDKFDELVAKVNEKDNDS